MKKYTVSVVGDIGLGEPVYNGQTAKTRDYIYYLSKRYGDDNVYSVDTRYWKRNVVKKVFLLLYAMICSDVLVLVLGQNGRKTILPLTLALKRFTRNRVLFSIVGGSLMYTIESEPKTIKCLHKTDGNYVETKMFKEFLENRGVPNVEYAPVFSKRESITNPDIVLSAVKEPYKFCTYSRVCKEKGITNAIEAVKRVNQDAGKIVCTLDIYGFPQEDYADEFENLVNQNKECVFVHPYLDDTNAIRVLSEHYMMLFPTYYSGEGFPIAIIECLKSGVPVIASDWHFNSEVVIDGETGLIYSLDRADELVHKIKWAIDNSVAVGAMKKKCLERATDFEPDKVLEKIYKKIDNHQ